jgi:sRNA-binding protein
MRKLLLLVAFAAGYVLGAKAGRQRYEQIVNAANRVKDEPHVRSAASTVAEAAKEQAPVVREKVAAVAGAAAAAAADHSPFGSSHEDEREEQPTPDGTAPQEKPSPGDLS